MKYKVIINIVLVALLSSFGIQGQIFIKKPILDNLLVKGHYESKESLDELARLNYYRPELQESVISPSGNFLIHFDVRDSNAVDLIDRDGNEIPDYIDSVAYYFDYAFEKEVNELGMLSPLPDSGAGGSDAYDIYVVESGVGRWDETFYSMTMNDLRIEAGSKFPSFTSFIVIDNDFSPYDSTMLDDGRKIQTFTTNGYEAVKISAVHEFNHAIQMIYGTPQPSAPFINEMTSVLFERVIFPDAEDYLRYVRDFFKFPELFPFSTPSPDVGYRYALFFEMIYETYGIEAIKSVWELIASGIYPYKAIDSSLVMRGASLDEEFCRYMRWIYFSGSRSIKGQYFDGSEKFGEFKRFKTKDLNTSSQFNGSLSPYEIRMYRGMSDDYNGKEKMDTVDISLTALDLENTNSLNVLPRDFVLKISENGDIRIDSSDLFIDANFYGESFRLNSYYHKYIQPKTLEYAFPSPYRVGEAESPLRFPVKSEKIYGRSAKLKLFTVDMKLIEKRFLPIVLVDKKAVVELFELPNTMTSGVYIFTTEAEKKLTGKFVIIK